MTDKKKKIVLISDDIHVPTGVSMMSKNIMKKTSDKFDWVQYGGLTDHPNHGRIDNFDGIKIYGATKFGNPEMLHTCIDKENPDGIMFFTDPRHFKHLFTEEYEIRQRIPWMYYTIWDNNPYPQYNLPYYESCDGVFCISKLTEQTVKNVLHNCDEKLVEDRVITYVPHGIDENIFQPMDRTDSKFQTKVEELIGFNPFEFQFIVLWSNKNMDRKKPQDIMKAFDRFIENNNLYPHDALLIMNTNPISKSGGDLYQFKYDHIINQNNIRFVENGSFKDEDIPYIYNMADIVVNNSDNEGWGLAVTEAKMCGVPVMATNVGGMKDQITTEEGEFGKWAFVLEPEVENYMGNPMTPYIVESRFNISKIVEQLEHAFFDYDYKGLKEIGELGRKDAISKGHTLDIMTQRISESITKTLENFSPREKLKIKKF